MHLTPGFQVSSEAPMHACVLSRFSLIQLYATLWTVARQALLSMGFSRQEYWRGLPCPPPGDLPDPGTEPESPALACSFITTVPSCAEAETRACIEVVYFEELPKESGGKDKDEGSREGGRANAPSILSGPHIVNF